ncbi:hypothetical protein MPSEU_001010000 [Mayamaea pseudoterrestris]|nr:hypothetical protein MPSEU_001010000 [Mayamaea pseudoterrestris]
MSVLSLTSLPEAFLHPIASYLEGPEVLSLLSCSKMLRDMGMNVAFWKSLAASISFPPLISNAVTQSNIDSVADAKQDFMQAAYCRLLPAVRWKRELIVYFGEARPSGREGHIACRLHGGNDENDLLIVTGGFTADTAIYVTNLSGNTYTDWRAMYSTISTPMVYGATLTTLDATRALRFGGFLSGGYANETHHVAILTVDYDNGSAQWTPQETSHYNVLPASLARAYHSATLLLGRYLIVIGGMKSGESTLYPVLLDTVTWTWHNVATNGDEPSPRHGCSVVFDEINNRLVLFGGGSGSNLLHSGNDFAEVWELEMSEGWRNNLIKSFPWNWNQVVKDTLPSDEIADGSHASLDSTLTLSPSEKRILGRCHIAHHVSPTKVVLAFGSGSPSTNGLIIFDLVANTFMRPRLLGCLPVARLSAASVYLENMGCIFVHSGFSTQREGTVNDAHLLDLAPALTSFELHFEGPEKEKDLGCSANKTATQTTTPLPW